MSLSQEYDQVLRTVLKWPEGDRRLFAQELLTTVSQRDKVAATKLTASEARGLLRGDCPAPTDEEVKEMIERHRMEKYG